MPTVKSERAEYKNPEALKPLIASPGPCLSVFIPLSSAGTNSAANQNRLTWRETLASVEEQAEAFPPARRALLASLGSWEAIETLVQASEDRLRAGSIAVFHSADVFQVVLLDQDVSPRAVIGPHFFIRPLLSELVKARSFYLLALSQKDTRLLHCTTRHSEEVPLPGTTKTNFDTWMNQVKPNHTAVNNAMTASAAGGGQPSALAPKGSDDEARDEYLAHFFKQVATGVNDTLKAKSEPLVLCGVEYEMPIYHKVNQYRNITPEAVHGAPNSLKSGEMHSRAIEALNRSYELKVDEALADWNHRVGAGASSRSKDVVTAAHDGRVLTLFVSDSQDLTGSFQPESNTVTGRPTDPQLDEDLVNDAAVQALLHGSKVLVVPHHKMPHGSPLAATFRY